MIPILVKTDDVRSGRNFKVRQGSIRPAQESISEERSEA